MELSKTGDYRPALRVVPPSFTGVETPFYSTFYSAALRRMANQPTTAKRPANLPTDKQKSRTHRCTSEPENAVKCVAALLVEVRGDREGHVELEALLRHAAVRWPL